MHPTTCMLCLLTDSLEPVYGRPNGTLRRSLRKSAMPAPENATLEHITFNTDHRARLPRPDLDAGTLEAARMLAFATQGGAIASLPGWYVDFQFPLEPDGKRLDGAAFLQLARQPGRSLSPAVMAVACWQPELSDAAWAQATVGYAAQKDVLAKLRFWREPGDAPTHLPWLAVWLTPWYLKVRPNEAVRLAAIEQLLVWAMVPPSK